MPLAAAGPCSMITGGSKLGEPHWAGNSCSAVRSPTASAPSTSQLQTHRSFARRCQVRPWHGGLSRTREPRPRAQGHCGRVIGHRGCSRFASWFAVGGLSLGSFSRRRSVGSAAVHSSQRFVCYSGKGQSRGVVLPSYFRADGRIEQLRGSPRRHCGPFPRVFDLSGLCRLPVVRCSCSLPIHLVKLHPFASGSDLLSHLRRP